MKTTSLTLSLLGALAALGVASTTASAQLAPPVVVQIGPTTDYSTINCANFIKLPDGTWQATAPVPFGLGFVQGIIPPVRPIKSGGFIYNNIDLYSQLNAQCGAGVVVTAKY